MEGLKFERSFDAAHLIKDHNGKCKRMHGHTFNVIIRVETYESNDIIIDFHDLKHVVDAFDHKTIVSDSAVIDDDKVIIESKGYKATLPLDWCEFVNGNIACSENIARTIKEKLVDMYPHKEFKVDVEESPGNVVSTGW